MPDKPRVLVYAACSLDGFIAGPEDELDWLDGRGGEGESDGDAIGYGEFIGGVGAMLMGRRTHDVVLGLTEAWPYGPMPVLVATHRPLEARAESVRVVSGEIGELVRQGLEAAAGKDLYLDGGSLIGQAVQEGLIDEVIVTMAPVAMGAGLPFFAGLAKPSEFDIVAHGRLGDMLQFRLAPADRQSRSDPRHGRG